MNKSNDMAGWRKQVDDIDARLLALLAERFQVTRQIGEYKASHDITVRDPGRESSQLDAIAEKAEQLDINPELARRLLQIIIEEAVKEHNQIRAERQL